MTVNRLSDISPQALGELRSWFEMDPVSTPWKRVRGKPDLAGLVTAPVPLTDLDDGGAASGQVLGFDGTDWEPVTLAAAPANGAWADVAFGTNWAHQDAAHFVQYRKDLTGEIHLRGTAARTTATYSYPSTIATLPSGYRPAQAVQRSVPRFDGTDLRWEQVMVVVNTDGTIQAAAGVDGVADSAAVGTLITLDSVTFFTD